MPEDRIRISGIAATGYHGVFDHERERGQTFLADVVLHLDTRPAAGGDDLARTVDYGRVAQAVAEVLAGDPADLIETVAERIAATLLDLGPVTAVDVTVHKPGAPIPVPFSDVTVEIHRSAQRPPALLPPAPVAEPEAAPEPVPVEPEPEVAPEPVPAEPEPVPVAAAPVPIVPMPVPVAPAPPAPQPVALPAATAPVAVPAAPVASPAPPVVPPPPPPPPAPAPERTPDQLDVPPPAPVDVVLALGSNVGTSRETLRSALAALDAVPGLELTGVGPLARTAPVGGPDQDDYLNTVVVGRTTLSPRALLHACQAVEAAHGRVREQRWGPRTLDVDVIVHGTTQAVADDLELPHPRANQRAFVLAPWAHVRPDAVLPGLGGGPVAALAETAPDRAGIRWMALDWYQEP